MVHAWVSRHSIDRGLSAIEAAPNSYTGSGQAAFPRTDGVPSAPSQRPAQAKVRAPETSPCHALARQSGELDPEGDDPRRADPSPHRERRKAWASLSRNASAQLGTCSTRGQPRWIQCACGPHLGPRRGGQSKADGVGPGPHESQGIAVPQACSRRRGRPCVPQFGVQLPTPGRVSS
jgi:hypothetical protein